MMIAPRVAVLIQLAGLYICFTVSLNNRPIIGILPQECKDGNLKLCPWGETYIQSAYVKFIESSGARVVPIKLLQPESYYIEMFKNINGLLIPGGSANQSSSGYARAGQIFFSLAIQANMAGDYFPIWATCLGFQILARMVDRNRKSTTVDARNYPLPLDLYWEFWGSKLQQEARPHIIEILQTQNVTNANHRFGITLHNFLSSEPLVRFYRILSTNVGRTGYRFVSAIEAREFPFWATQFHPEKTAFQWDESFAFLRTREALEVSQFFGNFFVDQARRSNHSFPNKDLELLSVIQNYSPVYPKKFYRFEQVYMFNITSNVITLD